MQEAVLLTKLRSLENRCEALQASLVQHEGRFFAMWSLMNVLLHLLKRTPVLQVKSSPRSWLPRALQMISSPVFDQAMFETIGKELHEKREEKIKELMQQAKNSGDPIPADAISPDNVQQALDSLPVSGSFQAEKEPPKLALVKEAPVEEGLLCH